MSTAGVAQDTIDRALALHGPLCRGLAIGIQAGRLARGLLGEDEDLVAVAESNHCAVDGIQVVTGCTVGNRNLVVRDWGKLAYTFYRRSDGLALRLAWIAGLDPAYQGLRSSVQAGVATEAQRAEFAALDRAETTRILDADPATLFEVVPMAGAVPVLPTMAPWVRCAHCEEQVMETRTRRLNGEIVCIACFEAARVVA